MLSQVDLDPLGIVGIGRDALEQRASAEVLCSSRQAAAPFCLDFLKLAEGQEVGSIPLAQSFLETF
jgi:hypothetical protein